MVPPGRACLRSLGGLSGLDRLDRISAERAADLAVTADPRGEHQTVDHGVTVKGQLGLVTGHLDPDGFLGLAHGVDRVQPQRPDRHTIPGDRLPLLVLEVLLGLGHTSHPELHVARIDQKSHDALLLEGVSWVVLDPGSSLDYTSLTVKLARLACPAKLDDQEGETTWPTSQSLSESAPIYADRSRKEVSDQGHSYRPSPK